MNDTRQKCSGTSYRVLVNRIGYSMAEFNVMKAVADECSARVEHVAAAIDVYDHPENILAKSTGIQPAAAKRLLDTIRKRDADTNKLARVPRPATRSAMPPPPESLVSRARHAAERGAVPSTSVRQDRRASPASR